jgi:hypothetical protein
VSLTVWNVNQNAANSGQFLYLLVAGMVAAGWVPVDGGDGTTYGAGLVWTSDAVAQLPGAWQRLRAGDGLREWVFGVNTMASGECAIGYSPTAGGAQDVAPGTGSRFPDVVGGWHRVVGAPGPPTLTTMFCYPHAMRVAVGCASAAGAGDGAFYALAAPLGGGFSVQVLLSYEPVAFADPGDPDPYVIRAGGHGNAGFDAGRGTIDAISQVAGFVGKGGGSGWGGLAGLALVQYAYPYSGNIHLFPAEPPNPGDHNGTGLNPFSGRWDHAPIPIAGSRTAPVEGFGGQSGWKGVSTLYRWLGSALGVGTPNVLELPGGVARLAFGQVSVEWPNVAVAWAP